MEQIVTWVVILVRHSPQILIPSAGWQRSAENRAEIANTFGRVL